MNLIEEYKNIKNEVEQKNNSSEEEKELLFTKLDKIEIELIKKAIAVMIEEDYPEDDIAYFESNINNYQYRDYLCQVSEKILTLHWNYS